MPRRSVRSLVSVGALGTALAVPLIAAAPAGAHGFGSTYVAPNASPYARGTSCQNARYSDIQAAVEATHAGGTVVVCAGTYHTSVTVDRRITLEGRHGAVIDATGNPYGIGVTASWSTIRGMTVENASGTDPSFPYDGIITAGLTDSGPVPADHVTIEHNKLNGNQGAGIDLNSTSYSVARDNVSNENGIGVNVSDDLGAPAKHNWIVGNVTNRNFGGCGIALADHSGLGVNGNVVSGNISDDNGLSTPTAPDASAGSGVILASPIPGGVVKNNLISFNEFHGNGHGGVVVHSHVPNIPNGPTSDFSGNRIIANFIGTNNLRTDTSDTRATGIYLGSASPLRIQVSDNVIAWDYYGIFKAGDVTLTGGHNHYVQVTVPIGGVPTY